MKFKIITGFIFTVLAALTLVQISLVNAQTNTSGRGPITGPVIDQLPAPDTYPVACSVNSPIAIFSWQPVTGADKYLLRVNKYPFNIWNPADKTTGDYSRLVRGNITHRDQVTSGIDYQWSIQALPAGVDYSPSGSISPWVNFRCNSNATPTPIPTASPIPSPIPTLSPSPSPIPTSFPIPSQPVITRLSYQNGRMIIDGNNFINGVLDGNHRIWGNHGSWGYAFAIYPFPNGLQWGSNQISLPWPSDMPNSGSVVVIAKNLYSQNFNYNVSLPSPSSTPIPTPTAAPLPDLVITSMNVVSAPMRVGHWNNIRVALKNQGTARYFRLSNVYLILRGSRGDTSCQVGLPSINPDSSATVDLYCISYSGGTNTATATVDANNNITESNENNNQYSKLIYVRQ